jgi:large subunit ribosomal protein L25
MSVALERRRRTLFLASGWLRGLCKASASDTLKLLSRSRVKRSALKERKEHRVPGLLYGGGEPNITVSVTAADLRPHARREDFFNRVLELELPESGRVCRAIPRQLDREFESREPSYVTFLRWPEDLEANPQMVPIPIKIVNEDVSPGVKAGNFLYQIFKTWRFRVTKEPIPSAIVVDAAPLVFEQGVKLSQLDIPDGIVPMPQGKLLNPTLAKVIKPN